MLEQTRLNLAHSEATVVDAASRIFAAYQASNRVDDSNEDEMVERSIKLAIKMAKRVDSLVKAEGEMS